MYIDIKTENALDGLEPLIVAITEDDRSLWRVVEEDDPVPTSIASALGELRKMGYAPRQVFVACDGLTRMVPFDPERHEAGDMQRAFEAGDMTVTEVLVVDGVNFGCGGAVHLHVPYRIGDDGSLVLGDVVLLGPVGGMIPNELARLAIEHVGGRN